MVIVELKSACAHVWALFTWSPPETMPCPAGCVFPGEILQYALRSHKTQEGNLHPASLENNYLGPKENKNKKSWLSVSKTEKSKWHEDELWSMVVVTSCFKHNLWPRVAFLTNPLCSRLLNFCGRPPRDTAIPHSLQTITHYFSGTLTWTCFDPFVVFMMQFVEVTNSGQTDVFILRSCDTLITNGSSLFKQLCHFEQ